MTAGDSSGNQGGRVVTNIIRPLFIFFRGAKHFPFKNMKFLFTCIVRKKVSSLRDPVKKKFFFQANGEFKNRNSNVRIWFPLQIFCTATTAKQSVQEKILYLRISDPTS